MKPKFLRPALLALLLCGGSVAARAFQLGAVTPGGGFVVFGRVSLPDGKPARRVPVYLESGNGLKRDTLTNEEGNYEFRGLQAGRFRVWATNPNVPEQYSDPAQSDSTRSYNNRLQIDVYLRLPLHKDKEVKPGTVSAIEAAQNVPKPARKAYEQGLKMQKDNQAEKALIAFNQAIELYPEYFQALTERANLLMQQNKLPEAEADFARALKINGKYAPALRGIGFCQIQQKNFAAAVSNLENAFVLEPSVPMTLMLLGYANLSLKRYEEAKQCLQQALKLGAESVPRAHVYLAEVFAHDGSFKEAADEIHAYLKAKPDAPDKASLEKMEADWRGRIKQ
jgi:tetratricopeptide (TPR) repeat protein